MNFASKYRMCWGFDSEKEPRILRGSQRHAWLRRKVCNRSSLRIVRVFHSTWIAYDREGVLRLNTRHECPAANSGSLVNSAWHPQRKHYHHYGRIEEPLGRIFHSPKTAHIIAAQTSNI